MNKKRSKNTKEDIIKCALEVSAKDGWGSVSLETVAKKAGLPLEELHVYFESKEDILSGFGRMIDRQVLENIEESTQDDDISPRDMLFDILMERFEVLNEYRPGVISILDFISLDYSQSITLLPHLAGSMGKMLEMSGIKVEGIRGAIKITGLTALYIKALRDWKIDEGADLPKTMASLDSALGYADRAVGYLGI